MRRHAAALAIFVLAGAAARPAGAETFVDFYGGWAMARDANVTAVRVLEDARVSEEVRFDTSFTAGARVGRWFESVPYLGLALDSSYFDLPGPRVDIGAGALSVLVMGRVPLFKDAERPGGRLQPYVAFGPAFYVARASADFRPRLSREISGYDADVGWDARSGLVWQVARSAGLFAEYRYTAFDIHIEHESAEWILGLPPRTVETLDARVRAHHFLIGVSLRL